MLDAIRRDRAYTARSLRRAPSFTVTVVLVLGLAIGMTSAMYTVFQSVAMARGSVRSAAMRRSSADRGPSRELRDSGLGTRARFLNMEPSPETR